MKVHVFDTYVKAKAGHTMHFDVITDTKDNQKAVEYAKKWLSSIGEQNAKVTTEECCFCHSENILDEIEIEIMKTVFSSKRWKAVSSRVVLHQILRQNHQACF